MKGDLPRLLTIIGTGPNKFIAASNDARNKDYFTMLGEQVLTVVDIAAKEVDKGITNIRKNIHSHSDGAINVSARTPAGKSAGRTAEKFLKHFLKEPWDGIMAHIIQESVDRFYIGADIYVNKKGGGNRGKRF